MSRRMPALALSFCLLAAPAVAQRRDDLRRFAKVKRRSFTEAVHTYYRLFTEHNMTALGTQVYHTPWISWAPAASRSTRRRPT